MRIIAGTMRGLRLASVGKGDAAAHLRPTADRVRESLFNTLTGGHYDDPLTDARVLDLFAGTGALGFEALSRGAAHATFVDDGNKARALIRENTALTKTGGQVKLYRRDATKLGDCQTAPFTLVFLDAPYGKGLGEKALAAARTGNWLAPSALIVWEENAPQQPPDGFTLLESRRYGDTHVTFLSYTSG
ncbi:16S rRNA (guanine(966)-N(2))-methyltransferase RsmD [Pseudoruegeria sp. HB172150]|uniref:16S rRNA (guanine(966)-N(2))-methyltransferase RsmD n=1 Tax=Pseudoruegeria sp. HB172150 TaxID=2721164 RepID=UPI001555D0E1|nr:16S rRNA (guanine(966)-N(2))-methyltransferase RsmD [Pseudoruegeria sp. HB172150]